MILTLIGMSGVGKSFRSKMLEDELGFERIDCDREIAIKLDKLNILPTGDGIKPTERLSHWMSQPNRPGYSQRRDIYLETEKQVMVEIMDRLDKLSPEERDRKNYAIDTTGSVIHLDQETQERVLSNRR